ncbi:uncharacterized protein LOC125684248 isoform X2 [Lagopus muta]|uniref:uncharacterized protein LOC125684248 isoform X2 n=1 Tax=Lagopus muta TaxID=64668 RepID=UPI0020A169BD|nr:uncharacterized protein LOC125684248 isoform X2 [Lagopus muta]
MQASHLRCLPRSGKPNKPHKLLTLQAERVSYRKPRGGAAPKGQAGNLSPVCGLRRAERGRKSPSCTELRAGLRQQQVKADGEQLGCSGPDYRGHKDKQSSAAGSAAEAELSFTRLPSSPAAADSPKLQLYLLANSTACSRQDVPRVGSFWLLCIGCEGSHGGQAQVWTSASRKATEPRSPCSTVG